MLTSISARASRWLIISFTFLVALIWSDHSQGVTRDSSVSPIDLVNEALHREIYGLPRERQQLLIEAVRKDGNNGPARWHLGFIQSGGEWLDVDKLAAEGTPELLKEYAANRDKCADTAEAQMLLANWCRDKQLPLQERAHLSRVLDLNGDHPIARERLGYRRVSGRWLTDAEIAEEAAQRINAEGAAKRWRPELVEIGRDLHHPHAARQAAARARIDAINDVHAIRAMESILSVPSQEGALAVIDAVGRIPGGAAVDSLVRHAVFSQWPLARQAAAERLKERELASFVPRMLREMYTPLVSRFGISETRDGRIIYTHAFVREGQEEQQVLQLDTEFNRIKIPEGDLEDSLMRAFETSFAGLAQREQEVARQNAMQEAYNRRVVEALKISTYQDIGNDPKLWWQWWEKQTDLVRPLGKQTRSLYRLDRIAIVDRVFDRPTTANYVETPIPSTPRSVAPISSRSLTSRSAFSRNNTRIACECFAAGTVVWTRYGEQPIEKIRVGDLVLAQNVETGEIAFKPVLGRTLRAADNLLKVRVGNDALECTHGHLFWVAGYGWAKAEKLESGVALHGLRGSLPLSAVENSLKAETFNLIVADYHTYFVGEQRLLSHDVTAMTPTQAVVPGLREE